MPINLSGELVQVINNRHIMCIILNYLFKLKVKELSQMNLKSLEVNYQGRSKSCLLNLYTKKNQSRKELVFSDLGRIQTCNLLSRNQVVE